MERQRRQGEREREEREEEGEERRRRREGEVPRRHRDAKSMAELAFLPMIEHIFQEI